MVEPPARACGVRHSTKRPTKAEQDRLDAVHALPCLACAQLIEARKILFQCGKTEAHHLVDKGTRKHSGGHMATIPLGEWHHRGKLIAGMSSLLMTELYGPSLALNKRAFAERFGGERILLVETDALIAANRHTEFA